MFDVNLFKGVNRVKKEYENQLSRLIKEGKEINNIEETIEAVMRNINNNDRSFVIYGEPQSGKTELIICLTANLIDHGHKTILILINDNIQLLKQNKDRFLKSGISPSPVGITDIGSSLNKGKIIFVKKNKNDLIRLGNYLNSERNIVIIDDEADFASPNSKINKDRISSINNSISNILRGNGIYIGITATPARLDLNHSFKNDVSKWVQFKPHSNYIGRRVFFPIDNENVKFNLNLFKMKEKEKHLRLAILQFLANVVLINEKRKEDENYFFLIHNSGNKSNHIKDQEKVTEIFHILTDENSLKYESYIETLFNYVKGKVNHNIDETNRIVIKILRYITRQQVLILNSDRNKNDSIDFSYPPALFTVVIGGNMVSRGVTFGNLLGMFFTRDVAKIQQDTYIQRARMFGDRKGYLDFFDFWIPTELYINWRKCFLYHEISIQSIKGGKKPPIWIGDKNIEPVSNYSVNRGIINIMKREVTFDMFDWVNKLESIMKSPNDNLEKIKRINLLLGDNILPMYVINLIENLITKSEEVSIHPIRNVKKRTKYHDTLIRPKGVLGGNDISKYPNAVHHFLIQRNENDKCRISYKNTYNLKLYSKIQD